MLGKRTQITVMKLNSVEEGTDLTDTEHGETENNGSDNENDCVSADGCTDSMPESGHMRADGSEWLHHSKLE
jgi:hypothetical protein